ncbi:small multi-drug export protein [Candidatus Saccharibacteria bacterium]|nr:small multi-drug export protein [Candidatus Saccharibacteria bacterium]
MIIILHCFIVLLVSMIPIIELRGAIPIGVSLGLPEPLALIIALIGNLIPVPFIYKFSRKILEKGSEGKIKWFKKFCNFCLKKGERAGKKLQKKTGDSIYVALLLFVGIPLPGTGVWTGTLAASLLDLNYKKTIQSVFFGVLLAGTIMLAISFGLFKLILGQS